MIIFIGGDQVSRRKITDTLAMMSRGRSVDPITFYRVDFKPFLSQNGAEICESDDEIDRAVALSEMFRRNIDSSLIKSHDWSKVLIVEGSFLDILNIKQMTDHTILLDDVPEWLSGLADDVELGKRVVHFYPIQESLLTIESRRQLQNELDHTLKVDGQVNVQFLAKQLSLFEKCEKILQFIEDHHLKTQTNSSDNKQTLKGKN